MAIGAMAGIGLAASALQTAVGATQAISGAIKKKKLVRPTYGMPSEILKNQQIAEQEATYGLDSESKKIATQGADRAMVSALNSAGTRKAGLVGLGSAVKYGADASLGLASADNEAMARKKAIAMAARSETAGYKDKEFSYNKDEPYRMKMEEAQALIGSGLQNIGGGINTAASIGMYGANGEEGGGDGTMKDKSVQVKPFWMSDKEWAKKQTAAAFMAKKNSNGSSQIIPE